MNRELVWVISTFHVPLSTNILYDSPAAMAHGALLRTIDKDDELERISLCSYGFLFQETYDPVRIPGHNEATSKFDKKDGITYVDAISWEIKKVGKA